MSSIFSNFSKAPEAHQSFLKQVKQKAEPDKRIIGIAVSGSLATGTSDTESDIDLQVVVDTVFYNQILKEREAFVSQFGNVLSAFTGEHVGEPRLTICLYEKDLLHVDFKFVTLDAFTDQRVEDPVVLFEKGTRLSDIVKDHPKFYPAVKAQWIEDRFWIWVHYIATKVKRGETIEALDSFSWLRGLALSPMVRAVKGQRNRSSRFLEKDAPEFKDKLLKTHPASGQSESLKKALQSSVELYVELRSLNKGPLNKRDQAEVRVKEYLEKI